MRSYPLWCLSLSCVLAPLAAPAAAEGASYALMPVRGPRGSAPKDVERAILDRLETRGDEGRLGEPRPGERGLSVRIRRRGRVFVAELRLEGAGASGAPNRRFATYHPRRGVSSAIAVLLDRLLDEQGSDAEPELDPEGAAELPAGDEAPEDPPEADPASVAPSREVEPPTSGTAAVDAPPDPTEPSASDRALGLELALRLGTQLLTRYTLSVDAVPTALAYRSGPLFLLSPALRFSPSSVPVWLDLTGDFASVGFTLATEPPLTPEVAGGAFLGLALSAGWAFELGSGISLAPAIGLRLERLGVEEQGVVIEGPGGDAMTEPFDVVLSSLAVVPTLGAVAQVELGGALTLRAGAHFRWIAAYAESPTRSGEGAGGLGLQLGLEASWAVVSWLAVELGLRYQYSAVGFSGAGTRAPFANDPPIVEASAQYEDLKLGLGPVVRF